MLAQMATLDREIYSLLSGLIQDFKNDENYI